MCERSASWQRRVRRGIPTSGRCAPSSHPARCSCCSNRRVAPTVALKIARFLRLVDPITRRESGPPPSPHLPEKHFYLELPPSQLLPLLRLGRLQVSGAMIKWSGGSSSHSIAAIGGEYVSSRWWLPLQRHHLGLLSLEVGGAYVCAHSWASAQRACVP